MVRIKTLQEIKLMRKLGKINSLIIKKLVRYARPGISAKDLEVQANILMEKFNVKPAFLGYKGFPSSLCISLNEELIHGVPSSRKIFKKGDLVSIDLGLYDGSFYSDCAYSFSIGRPLSLAKDLLRVGEAALKKAIAIIKPKIKIGDIGYTIQSFVERAGFCVVKKFVGHGVGKQLHEEPEVPNFGKPSEGLELKEGMTLAIEPMLTLESPDVEILEDGWTVVSKDRNLCVHFEHTIAVTKKGCWVLTA
ncbi:MAG TPA: type I methionyl aminopeptidase [Candidatus Omnitrophica bacterium]|nr:type I methionyl aminopeptidase [Candidatus Omnitrophota bacterium]